MRIPADRISPAQPQPNQIISPGSLVWGSLLSGGVGGGGLRRGTLHPTSRKRYRGRLSDLRTPTERFLSVQKAQQGLLGGRMSQGRRMAGREMRA